MALTCNIDARGKAVRLKFGLGSTIVGAVAVAAWSVGASSWMGAVGLALALTGAFAVFEARAGWCAARALGIKTPL